MICPSWGYSLLLDGGVFNENEPEQPMCMRVG